MESISVRPVSTGLKGILSRHLGSGEVGVVMARAGVGKTAFLTLLALEEICSGGRVLHVCIDEPPDKIKGWYKELIRIHSGETSATTLKSVEKNIEAKRFIMSYLHNSFSPGRLRDVFENVTSQADFHPSLVVVDGLDFERYDRRFFESFKELVSQKGFPTWTSARTHRHIDKKSDKGIPYPCHLIDDLMDVIILLDPDESGEISMKVLKDRSDYSVSETGPTLKLRPQTFTVLR